MIAARKNDLVKNCRSLLSAYKDGSLGPCPMPEDAAPSFSDTEREERLVFFTLPMSLNYQRNSYKLWESARQTWDDEQTKHIYSIRESSIMPESELRTYLMRYKIALQPNKHIKTWQTLAQTINREWGSLSNMFDSVNKDFHLLRQLIQKTHKKSFPYLSGPKIFNYWSFIISTYGKMPLRNREAIEIAPDTHITKGSVRLGIISELESTTINREEISARWRILLEGSGIDPIDMHPPLWFWSRAGFQYTVE